MPVQTQIRLTEMGGQLVDYQIYLVLLFEAEELDSCCQTHRGDRTLLSQSFPETAIKKIKGCHERGELEDMSKSLSRQA